MAVLSIVKEREENNEVLHRVCRPVEKITPRILTLLDDMIQTLHEANGCGLAAPQVGVLRRVVIVETEPGEIIELINPEIVERRGKQREVEGCLSLPHEWGIAERPMWVKVKALNRAGEEITVEGKGLKARAFCHELDHLDGVLFCDNAIRMLSPDEIEE